MSKETLNYYNLKENCYANQTFESDMKNSLKEFEKYIFDKAYVLDFGCGSGRDTLYFKENGYRVDALDGSEEMCKFSSELTGIKTIHMDFLEFIEVDKYDGIWACASLLHLNTNNLIEVLMNLNNSLKSNGFLYASFKFGEFEGIRDGRFFNDMTKVKFERILEKVNNYKLEKVWITNDVRKERSELKWLNLIMRKII